ncbi:T9SS type A sorting domain-containing protein [Deminuibacter soli]|uniref:T9SS C-terminal target domain-containing protein n=1 Tax=Deminuibacter soli TaxID=2291815 RepID=A0A3E1NEJ3_9BACT|nr:T9SS type A sorting domain-containing protein [Deminuibacter soli]RFM26297.1 T9SS C-terminal target domain-containing protein [Deminuibacter soli]
MRKLLPKLLAPLTLTFGLCASVANAQTVAYAVTSDSLIGLNWNVFRAVDLGSGAGGDALGRAPVTDKVMNTTGVSKVAACAYDRTSGKLYFVVLPMNDLYVVTPNGRNIPEKIGTLPLPAPATPGSEENNITRMAIGVDGRGYALSNNGNHLFAFTAGKHPVITELGALKDAASNGAQSVHTPLNSWGGDMVADVNGFLYLIDMYNKLFKIDVNKLEATLQGTIQGLPQGFYTNGAAVDDNDKLVLSSVTYDKGYYLLDMSSLKATPAAGSKGVYGASDLTSSNLLYENRNKDVAVKTIQPAQDVNPNISVWPNPVTNGQFSVIFKNVPKGAYTVQLMDIKGNLFSSYVTKVDVAGQNIVYRYGSDVLNGMYFVKIISADGKTHSTHKIIVAAQ